MERLLTQFGEKVNKELPLNDYPRPQMARDSFQNLNGIWKYAIYNKGEKFTNGYDGEIVVPFSPESLLSGVERVVTPKDELRYHRSFDFKKENDVQLLHFGAVDYIATVYINGKNLGTHTGGYYPFSFDITDVLKEGKNDIDVVVTDPSETGTQARGKQTSKRGGIWYTPSSGIWQTVWIEQVPASYIVGIKLTPDIDKEELNVKVTYSQEVMPTTISVFDGEDLITTVQTDSGDCDIKIPNAKLWSPEDPFLYNLVITSEKDEVKSYFGMRKFSTGKDKNGFTRLMLNNKPYFHNGLLDQGYWSDGMYTAPTDEAMIYDIQSMKDLGFNMLRKHIKIEPLRWYYHCDRLGMLVWQDMISGGGIYSMSAIALVPGIDLFLNTKISRRDDTEKNYGFFAREDKQGRDEYYEDSERMVNLLYNAVSIALWVPFNEGWGQFDALKAEEFYRKLDPTRLIDHASGWHDQGGGDLNSFHIYMSPFWFPKFKKNGFKDERAIALTEYGGYSYKVEGHVFNPNKVFGYRVYKTKEDYEKAMTKLFGKMAVLTQTKGLSALVYTEVSDVEDELNGLFTYDRRVLKIDPELMKSLNEEIKLED